MNFRVLGVIRLNARRISEVLVGAGNPDLRLTSPQRNKPLLQQFVTVTSHDYLSKVKGRITRQCAVVALV